MDFIEAFIASPDVQLSAPATSSTIEAFQQDAGLRLPESFRQLYEKSDGLTIEAAGFRFLSLEESRQYLAAFADWGITTRWGFFPFTDTNDSNPYCACCNEPLAGMIVHIFHDDAARLEFRDLESFLAALLHFTRSEGRAPVDELESPYDSSQQRIAGEIAAARMLLGIANTLPDDARDRDQAQEFAVRLLSEENIDELAKLLDASAPVRAAAFERLAQFQTAPAKTAIQRFRDAYERFRANATMAIRDAGINIEEIKGDCLLIQPSHVWMDLGCFYERHNHPDVFSYIVSKARAFAAMHK